MLAIAGLAQSQNIDPTPSEFEVATIKPSTFEAGPRWFRFIDARRWTAFNQTLKQCIAQAYKLPPALISGGPAWVDSERYEIVAIEPAKPGSAEQNMLRFQNLLADRFKLRFHRERKQMAVYNLTVGKSGPKMTESTLTPEKGNLMINPSPRGGPLLPARAATMERFASVLQDLLDRPVIDKTGLTKRYDFDFGVFTGRHATRAPRRRVRTSCRQPGYFHRNPADRTETGTCKRRS